MTAFVPLNLLLILLLPLAAAQTVVSTITVAPSAASAIPQYTSTAEFTSAILNTTNSYRQQHSAAALAWNASLASFASSYLANVSCAFQHSGGPDGENLAEGYANATAAVDAWGNERAEYDWGNPGFSEQTGHFTQLVWNATTTVGCGRAFCGDQHGWYVVCEYWPRGNVEGEYQQNVAQEATQNETCVQGQQCGVAAAVMVERSLSLAAVVLAMGLAMIM